MSISSISFKRQPFFISSSPDADFALCAPEEDFDGGLSQPPFLQGHTSRNLTRDWYDSEGTPGLTDELCKLVEDAGDRLVRTDIPEAYGIEYAYELNERYIHVGSTGEYGPTACIYAYNPNTCDE